jgi:two-component sensor histidine kinase
VQHAFGTERRVLRSGRAPKRRPAGAEGAGRVEVELRHGGGGLAIEVRDNGVGLPKGFDIERTNSLGLSIVHDLVVSQLDGSIEMRRVPPAEGGGTVVGISVPLGPRV